MQTVSFLHPSPRNHRSGQTLTCRETGLRYYMDIVASEWMIHRGDWEPIGFRMNRGDALTLIEQHARLDFLASQADCGAYSA